MKNQLTKTALTVAVTLLSGCSKPVQLYTGGPREAHEVAKVVGSLGFGALAPSIGIAEIDGVRVRPENEEVKAPSSAELLPGTHNIRVELTRSNFGTEMVTSSSRAANSCGGTLRGCGLVAGNQYQLDYKKRAHATKEEQRRGNILFTLTNTSNQKVVCEFRTFCSHF